MIGKELVMAKKIVATILTSFVFLLFGSSPVIAAKTTIMVAPSTGSYNASFQVSVVIDGNGDVFNAAEAIASVSANLAVQDVVLGDCNFSYIRPPSVANLSFRGVALGKSLKKCTVYTATLAPVSQGSGSVTLSEASVKRYGDAVNVLSSVQNGSYTLTGAVSVNTATTPEPQEGLYSVVLNVSSVKENKPLDGIKVVLKSVSSDKPLESVTDKSGRVQFLNIPSGVYQQTAEGFSGDTIINVTGPNKVLVLGIKLTPAEKNYLIILGSAGTLIIIGIVIFLRLRKPRRI